MSLHPLATSVNPSAADCANSRQMRFCMQISDSVPGGKRTAQTAQRPVDRGSDGQAGSTRQEGTQNGLKPADVHR